MVVIGFGYVGRPHHTPDFIRPDIAPERDAFNLNRLPLGSLLRIRRGLRSTRMRGDFAHDLVRKVCNFTGSCANFAIVVDAARDRPWFRFGRRPAEFD